MPLKEAEATNSLVDQQVDVVITRVDSPKTVITTAEKRGIYSCGYRVNEQNITPKGFLTGIEWNREQINKNYAEMLKNALQRPVISSQPGKNVERRSGIGASR